MKLTTFLKSHKSTKTLPHTHTRIGDHKTIYGGSYHIPDDKLNEFYKLYFDAVIVGENPIMEYLTERQNTGDDNSALYIDFDFRHQVNIKERQFDGEFVQDIAGMVIDKINALCSDSETPIKLYIMTKDDVNVCEKYTKDGIHIATNIIMPRHIQMVLRENIMKDEGFKALCDNVNIINDMESIYDDGITKGTVNTQLYGSRKPHHDAYHIVATASVDEDGDIEFSEDVDIDFETFKTVCVKTTEHKIIPNYIPVEKPKKKAKKVKLNVVPDSNDIILNFNPSKIENEEQLKTAYKSIESDETKKVMDFLNALPAEYTNDFQKWIRVGWALKCTNEAYFVLWIVFSQSSEKFDYRDIAGFYEKWCDEFLTFEQSHEKYDNGGLTFASIAEWVKQENPEEFIKLIEKYHMETYTIERLALNPNAEYDFALHFKQCFPNKVIYSKQQLYIYNGVFWEQDNAKSSMLSNLISSQYVKVFKTEEVKYQKQLTKLVNLQILKPQTEQSEESPEITKVRKIINGIKSIITNLKKTAFKKNLRCEISDVCVNEKIRWETKTNLYAFTNKVFDLNAGEWVEPRYDQYINMTTGYDWREPSQEEIDTVVNLINKILPNPEIRKYYLMLMATGLHGETLQKFIVALGEGRNGKGCLNDFIKCMMGEYGYELNSSVLQSAIKDGVNQDIANMENKRWVITREPGGKGVCNATVRQITGGSSLSARGAYDKDTHKQIRQTLIMETNDWLEYVNKVETADIDRLINIPFNSYFTKDKTEVDEENHKYYGDDKYTTNAFREQHKFALLKILLDYNKIYVDNNKNAFDFEPEAVKELTRHYLTNADKFISWTNERLIKLTTEEIETVEEPYVRMKDLYYKLKNDEFYQQLSKKEKRKDASYTGFCKYLKKSYLYKKDFVEDKIIKKKHLRSVLYGYKYQEPMGDEEYECGLDMDED